jgi:O-antigen/teichoic acid export membrane protein
MSSAPNSPSPLEDTMGDAPDMFRERSWMNSATPSLSVTAQVSAVRPPVQGTSLRWNFSWTFVGNVIYSGCQWSMLVLLAKIGNPEMVGQYGLAMAVAGPVLALSGLQLRAVLTTDVQEQIHFGEYLGFRLLTTVLSLVVIGGLAFKYHGGARLVILVVGVAQAIEIVSDMYYAKMQFHDHMDRIAKSMIFRGILGLAAMGAGVYLTGKLIWGVAGLTLARAIVVVTYDIRKRTHLRASAVSNHRGVGQTPALSAGALRPRWSLSAQNELLRTSITLGIIAMLVSLLPNIPRYFIAGSLGERALGIFTATAFLVSTGNLIIMAMGQAAFVRLAKHYAAGDVAGFNSLLMKLLGIAATLGLAGIGFAMLFGRVLLTLLYRPEYAEHTDLLVAMMVAGAFSYVAAILGSAVTSARHFKSQIPVLLAAVASAAIASVLLVPSRGLLGAALVVVITSTILCAGQAMLLWFVLRNANLRGSAAG